MTLALLTVGVISLFKIRTVKITGNSFYSAQEIQDRIITDRYTENSLYLYLKYKYFNKEEIPFVDKLEAVSYTHLSGTRCDSTASQDEIWPDRA